MTATGPRPHALRHLTAWNEGDTEAIPPGYGPDALDWQLDLRWLLQDRGIAIDDIAAERQRQIDVEGWTPDHDDGHQYGELAFAAASYCVHAANPHAQLDASIGRQGRWQNLGWATLWRLLWPWKELDWWKPKDPRRDLVRAAALIVAEIERLDRAQDSECGGPT